jgi:hypothetical protein
MKKVVMPLGITDVDTSISSKTEEILSSFFENFNANNTLTRMEYIQEVGEAIGAARSLKELKEKNNKASLKTSIEKIDEALSKLIPALEEIDGYALSLLISEIDKEVGYLEFPNIEPFRQPGEYAEYVLKPFHQKITSSFKILADTSELRKQDWKYDLSIKLIGLYRVITGSFPDNIGSGGSATTPIFYQFVDDISIKELGEHLSERVIRKAIVDSKLGSSAQDNNS